jgi:hypothetical protein
MNHDERRDRPDPELGPLLDALPRELPAPAGVEARLIGSLRALERRRRLRTLAAAAAVFAVGLGAGRLLTAAADSPAGGFLLLLYEDGSYRPAEPGAEAARVDEYRSWARGVAAQGVPITGERLEDGGAIGGFFFVAVPTKMEAERIAATCPHVRYGGRVVVKAALPAT